MEPIICVTGLTKIFGRRRRVVAVDELSFSIVPGQAVALWGPNGAGKTTVIKCLLGLLRYRGQVQVGGHDARRQGKAARRLMGYVPQEITFHHDLSVAQTLHFYARLKKVEPARIRPVLEQVELAEHAHKTVEALSGGMKQRLALAIALMSDPPVLLLDEPTSNLDLAHQTLVLEAVRRQAERGIAVLAVMHDLNLAAALADELVLLVGGEIRAAGPPRQVLRDGLLSAAYGCPVSPNRTPGGERPFVLPPAVLLGRPAPATRLVEDACDPHPAPACP